MRRALIVSWVVGCSIGSAPAGWARPGELPPRSALEGVTALRMPVSVTQTKIPLGELVQQVAAQTGVPLTAAPEVADEPVAVVVKALPARLLLEQVAALLEYQWSRRGREGAWRYEVGQDRADQQREAALRRATLADVERRFDEEIRRYAEVGALSREDLQRLIDGERKRDPGMKQMQGRGGIATQLASPVNRSLATLLGRLLPQQWALLKQDYPISFSTHPQAGELALPQEVVGSFRSSPPRLSIPSDHPAASTPAGEEQLRQAEQAMRQEWAGADGYLVTIRLDADGWKKSGSIVLNVTAAPLSFAALSQSASVPEMIGACLTIGATPSPYLERMRAPQKRDRLETDPVLGARKRFPPGSSARRSLQDLLPALARIYKINIISDSYWYSSPSLPVSAAGADPVALSRLLDRLAGTTHDWDYRTGMVRLRSRTWFFDRPREVPLRFVRRWRSLYEQQGALPLEAYLEMANGLNDTRLGCLGDLVSIAGLPEELGGVYAARHALRLYTALSPAQRQALWQGTALPVAQMTLPQRVLFLEALRSRYELPPSNPRELIQGSVSVVIAPYLRARETRGGSTQYRDVPAATLESPPPGARRSQGSDAVGTGLTPGRQTRTQYPVTQIGFRYHLGTEDPSEVSITIASPSGSPPTSASSR